MNIAPQTKGMGCGAIARGVAGRLSASAGILLASPVQAGNPTRNMLDANCGRGAVTPAMPTPNSFMMPKSFPIDQGKIDQAEAVMANYPYKMRNEICRDGGHAARAIGVPAR